MQSFQLQKMWYNLSWSWQAGDGLYSTLLERHLWCRSWHAHHYPTILHFFGQLLLGIIMCPSRLQINRFITLLGRFRLSGDLLLQMTFLIECKNFLAFNFRQTFAPRHVGDPRNMSGWCNINSSTGNDRLSWVNVYFCGADIYPLKHFCTCQCTRTK